MKFTIRCVFVVLIVTLSAIQVSAILDHIQMHSIFPPILADYWENGLHYWSFGSSSVVTDDYVRLTTKSPTAKGYFWNRHPNHLESFVANTTLRFWQRSAGWFADATDGGVGIWYTAATPRHMPTQFFGNVDVFDGLGIILDHSDSISVVVGDGERSVGSLKESRRAFCAVKRLEMHKITISVSYRAESKELAVMYHTWMDPKSPGKENLCTVVHDVNLPLRNYFGVTGSNSEHAQAEHDLFSFFVKPLRSDDKTADDEEETAGLHLFDRAREQLLQKEWNGRADEPLSKDRPAPEEVADGPQAE